MKIRFLFLLFLACTSLSSAQEADAKLLMSYMTGNFNNQAQAGVDTNYNSYFLNISRIWKKRDGIWLYSEHAESTTPDEPYQQRVYQLKVDDKNRVSSDLYEIRDKSKWAGAWKKPKKVKSLSYDEIILQDGCSLGMIYSDGKFEGNTQNRCETERKGASLATSELSVYENRIEFWERGWNKQGELIWGAKRGPYIFIKE